MSAEKPKLPSLVYGPRAPPPLELTFGQLLDHHADVRGDKPAIISHPQKKTISFKQLRDRSIQLARAMAQEGIGKGDLVGLNSGSRYEYLEVFYACARLGAASVMFNYAYTDSEMLALVKNNNPKILFTPPGFQRYDYTKVLPKISKEVKSLKRIVLFGDIEQKYKLSDKSSAFIDYEEFLKKHESASWDPPKDLSPHDMVNVEFTSGSTGLPKSVALSHYNIMNCGRNISLQTRMTNDDRICLPVPLFHSFGTIVGISSSSVAGNAIVLPAELYDPAATLHCIQEYKCTALYGVTTMFVTEMANKTFGDIDKSSLKFAIVAGSAMPPEFLRRVMSQFSISRFYTCWGMTELSSFATMMHETDPWDKRIHTTGRLFPNFILKIVDPAAKEGESGKMVPWGEKGEIVVSGYGQMREYLGNKEKTEESLQRHKEDLEKGGVGPLLEAEVGSGTEEGELRKWMHTGDEGMLDEDGYLVFTGRIKDLIIRGGENIAPLEIEARLNDHESIEQASVVGVPNEKYGEEIGAFIECKEGKDKLSDDEIKKWVRQELSYFKAPRYVWWLGGDQEGVPKEWPKTNTGKISKPDLRKIVEKLVPDESKKAKAKL